MTERIGRSLLCAVAALALAVLTGAPAAAEAVYAGETDGDCLYTLTDEQGKALTQRGGRIYEGDEYIAADDSWYRVISVDDAARTATAQYLGSALADREAFAAFTAALAEAGGDGKKLIAMYSTHSDESYVPEDGTASKWKGAGIYDVGDSLKEALEERGVEVVYDKSSFLPHDADAYSRSRRTAEELLKQGPDALLDIHRDAVPAEQYETEVDGEDISKVRLFVGRSNQNSAENKAFAQQIKAAADEKYPGLIKDIFIGRGNYNQELYPHALLLEFGTHEIEKEKAQEATGYIAEILSDVLYGPSAKAEGAKGTQGSAVARGIGWVVGLAAVAAIVYALAATGSFKGAWRKLGRNVSEITGGMIGNRDGRKR
ncbi:MAG: stage II sporulation protein P [Clostridia bacterium]|nr:stage II sporulation protein P [Clostridia bacterium]